MYHHQGHCFPTNPIAVDRDLNHVLRKYQPGRNPTVCWETDFDDYRVIEAWVCRFCNVFHALFSLIQEQVGGVQANFFLTEAAQTTGLFFDIAPDRFGPTVRLKPFNKHGVFRASYVNDQTVVMEEIICLYRGVFSKIPLNRKVLEAMGLTHVIYLPAQHSMREMYYDVFSSSMGIEPYYYREDEYADLIEAPLTELHQSHPDAVFIPLTETLSGQAKIEEVKKPSFIQSAFNDALARTRGFSDAGEMIAAMDRVFGPSPKDPQERFNLSFARSHGYETVERFLAETQKAK